VAEDLAADVADVALDEVTVDDADASDPRARARALVAEVLAAHAARTSGPDPDAQPDVADATDAQPDATDAAQRVAEPELLFGQHRSQPTAHRTEPSADSTARLRARELVAEALADAEERDAAARAEAEARAAEERAAAEAAARAEAEAAAEREAARRIEEARRAEAERAEAERIRQEAIDRERREEAARLERERERAAAEARERELWADADRDVASETAPVDVRAGDDRTAPMSVAELAATGHPDDDPDRTALVARDDGGSTAFVRRDATEAVAQEHVDHVPTDDRPADAADRVPAATGTLALPREELERAADAPVAPVPSVAPRSAEVVDRDAADVEAEAPPPADPRVLEAVVDLDTPLPPARGGRWLLVSVIGAITLAIVFPLAIRALLQLVALS
jgi:colicin import membrane protein